jgi:hypothetical protein
MMTASGQEHDKQEHDKQEHDKQERTMMPGVRSWSGLVKPVARAARQPLRCLSGTGDSETSDESGG